VVIAQCIWNQVTSGAGTTNQVTKRLGHFNNSGRGFKRMIGFAIEPMMVWLRLPIVKLAGVTTLRLSSAHLIRIILCSCKPAAFR